MASSTLNDKANGSRLSRLLVDKGTQALRHVFDEYVKYSPSGTLTGVLSANKTKLQALRYKVIHSSQWWLLYPTSGAPDSKTFDVTLLTVVLRQICGLASPTAGWSTMPPDSDTSISANILRIKMFRNEVYAHVTTTEVDNNTFNTLWEKISKALVALGIPSHEIDELKEAPLSPEEDGYICQLEEWKKEEDKLIEIALDTNATVKEILRIVKPNESKDVTDIDKLAKCDFKGRIRELSASFHEGTRAWLFERLGRWFIDPDSKAMILTAGPGIGKSVLAAKVCEIYQKSGQLAACHFCKFNNSDHKNPHILLQSLASQMCDNVKGFKDKLVEQLQRSHCKETLSDAFRVLLNDPLHALESRNPMLIVIDAMDESLVEGKSEMLELISEEFPNLPKWIKVLITSRPELPVQEKLSRLKPLEIKPGDKENQTDLFEYLKSCLSSTSGGDRYGVLSSAVEKCQDSFLYAYYVQLELRELKQLTIENLSNLVPEGITGFYMKQFGRLKTLFGSLELEFAAFTNVLSAAKTPLPLDLLEECMGFSETCDVELRNTVYEMMSSVLPVYNDCLTVYHKSLVDWLRSDGYRIHAFTADTEDGVKRLWNACEKLLDKVANREKFPGLKITLAIKYALEYGIFYLIHIGDVNKYYLLFDVSLNYTTSRYFGFSHVKGYWNAAMKSLQNTTSTCIRAKLFRHSLINKMCEQCEHDPLLFYLQCVANGLTVMNDDGDQKAALSLLKRERYICSEDLNSILEQSNQVCGTSFEKPFHCICIARNKQLEAVSYSYCTISILKWPNLEMLYEYRDDEMSVSCLTFSPDCSILLYGLLCSCLDVNLGEKIPFFPHYPGKFSSCSFSPSGSRLVTADGLRCVRLWDVNKKDLLMFLDCGNVGVNECFFSKCGLFIIGEHTYETTNSSLPLRGNGNLDSDDVYGSLLIWNALTLQRVDQRYLHSMQKNGSYQSGIHWFEYFKEKEKRMEFVVVGNRWCCTIVCRLPYGLPVCRFRQIKPIAVTKCLNGDCILVYRFENRSFSTVDLVQKAVLATRRIYWLPEYSGLVGTIFLNEDCFVLPGYPFFSFKTPDKVTALNPCCYSSNVNITCCSFSPNGLFLATCDNHGFVRIWSVDSCSVTQTHTFERPAIGSWWSETCVWFLFSNYFEQIPAPVKQKLKFTEAKRTDFRQNVPSFLIFSEGVLLFLSTNYNIRIIKIVDDKLQNDTILSTDEYFDSAAVSPDSRTILLSSTTKYQVWQEVVIGDLVWRASFLAGQQLFENTGGKELSSNCCITSDGLCGIVVGLLTVDLLSHKGCRSLDYVVVNLMSGEIVKRGDQDLMIWSESIFATSSFLIFSDYRWNFHLKKLKEGTSAVVWYRWDRSLVPSFKTVFAFCARYNLLAIPEWDGYINFVKIHDGEK